MRNVELVMESAEDIAIGEVELKELPRRLTLIKSLQLPSEPLCVCTHNGCVYVGLQNKTISRIDADLQLHNTFITTPRPAKSIVAYKDRLYVLICCTPLHVNVYDMTGKQVAHWQHSRFKYISTMLTVMDNEVIIADPPNSRVVVYSLTGEMLRHVPCPLLTAGGTGMCAVTEGCVIISRVFESKVFKINIHTGEVMWAISGIKSPQGITLYGQYTLVAASKEETIYVLDSDTG